MNFVKTREPEPAFPTPPATQVKEVLGALGSEKHVKEWERRGRGTSKVSCHRDICNSRDTGLCLDSGGVCGITSCCAWEIWHRQPPMWLWSWSLLWRMWWCLLGKCGCSPAPGRGEAGPSLLLAPASQDIWVHCHVLLDSSPGWLPLSLWELPLLQSNVHPWNWLPFPHGHGWWV